MLRRALLAVGLVSCASNANDVDPYATQTYSFGPYTIDPGADDDTKCVQISLNNTTDLYVNKVELTTGPGFHHSNWFYVPQTLFAGADGTFTCADRNFDQVAAGILGGVFFAQSTQAQHEVQEFAPGTAIKVPAYHKLVSTIHLLNRADDAASIEPSIAITPLPPADVTTRLANLTFEFHPLGLPPNGRSRFVIECDLSQRPDELAARPDFNIYYALAHYHEWGQKMTLEAVRPDGTASMVYTTENAVGDALGGMVAPAFSMAGFTKVRLTCEYLNDMATPIYYGNGIGEMCIINAFTDSPYIWAGGALDSGLPGTPVDVGGVPTFTRNCSVYASDAER